MGDTAQPGPVHVRRATPSDADAISRLALEVQDWHVAGRPDVFKAGGYDFAPEIAARVASADQFYWVAVIGDAVIGYAYARGVDEPENRWKWASRVLVLDQMGVASSHRRLGAGELLWDAVRETAVAQHVDRVVLNVWAFNTVARQFYEHLGFTPFQERMAVEVGPPRPNGPR
jgi:ribosomal protein S18 acetylase RimI-like enzyme